MKFSIKKRIKAHDTGPGFTSDLKPLMMGFNDAVEAHSKKSGCGIEWLLGQLKVWVLHRIFIRIHKMPRIGEELTFVTWHKGHKGYKGFRDYEIWLGSEKIISAASSWLFLDLDRNKLMKIPKERSQCYTVETDHAVDYDIEQFIPVQKLDCKAYETITTRRSDFDPIGHVNNALYLDFLETAMARLLEPGYEIETIMIQFHKEISLNENQVQVGIKEEAGRFKFIIKSDTGIHAFGEFNIKR